MITKNVIKHLNEFFLSYAQKIYYSFKKPCTGLKTFIAAYCAEIYVKSNYIGIKL